ncbi:MAG: cation diffusion facilitator family transporter [Rhodospirillaceae bacterium]|nr:cation diffusion facilitator family transporter [Rhodospirillaceae bacterium]
MTGGEAGRLMRLATVAAVASALVLLGLKTWAYFATHSVALLSSLADSALDLMASGLNFMAVRFSLTPADEQHRFGHGKAEPLSALGQATFVAGSGVLIVVEAISRFSAPVVVPNSGLGIAVSVASIVVTLALVSFQRFVVKRTGSLAITADSLHYTGDILLNGSVIAALVLSSLSNFPWADPVFGIGISLFILVNAARIARHAVAALMDMELPEAERQQILAIAGQHPKVRHVHELRTRSSGAQKFIQMHLVLDHTLSLLDAHRIADDVEKAVEAAFPGADIIIHEDPEGVAEFHPPVGGAFH